MTKRQAAEIERRQAATIEDAVDSYNLGAENAFRSAGVKSGKNEKGFVSPSVAPSEQLGETIQFDTGETTGDDLTDPLTGDRRQIEATGLIKPKKRTRTTVRAGDPNNPNYPDPSKLYRVYGSQLDPGKGDEEQPFAATRAEEIGSAYDLRGASDPSISGLAQETYTKQKQAEIRGVKDVLDEQGARIEVDFSRLKEERERLKNIPLVDPAPAGNSMDPAIAAQVGGKADRAQRDNVSRQLGMSRDEEIRQVEEGIAKNRQEAIRNQALKTDLASQMALDEGESLFDNRVQQLLKAGAKKEDIEADPLLKAISEGFGRINKPVIPLDEIFKDAGMPSSAIYETRSSKREKAKIEADARLQSAKVKEQLQPFLDDATDKEASYSIVAGRRNRLVKIQNKLLDDADAADASSPGSGLSLRAQAAGYGQAIDDLDKYLGKIGPMVDTAKKSASDMQGLVSEREQSIGSNAKQRISAIEAETARRVEKAKKRNDLESRGYFQGPLQVDPGTTEPDPTKPPEDPTSWFEGIKEGAGKLFSGDTLRQAARGYFEMNQKFASGIYLNAANDIRKRGLADVLSTNTMTPQNVTAVLRVSDYLFGGKLTKSAASFFEGAAEAAKANENAIRDEEFLGIDPTKREYRESDVGQVVKAISELPFYLSGGGVAAETKAAALAPRIFAALAGSPTRFIPTFGVSYDSAIQSQLEAGVKDPDHVVALAEALPVSVFEQAGNSIEFGLGKLLGKGLVDRMKTMTAGSLRGLFARGASQITLGGVTESVEEALQQFWSNAIAKYLGKFDPDRPITKDVWQSVKVALWAGGAGVASLGGGAVILGGAENALSAKGLRKQLEDFRAATDDVPAGGWSNWADTLPGQILDPGMAESFGDIGAGLDEQQTEYLKRIAGSIKGAPLRRLVQLADSIDKDIGAGTPPKLRDGIAGKIRKSITGEENEKLAATAKLYAERANIANMIQNEAKLRLAVAREIGELSAEPISGGLDEQQAALIAAKVIFGSDGVTQEELKAKYRGQSIIQRDSNGLAVVSEPVKDILLKTPTLSELLGQYMTAGVELAAEAGGAPGGEPPEQDMTPPQPEREPTGQPRRGDTANLKTPQQISQASARTGSPALMARLEGATPDERWASVESKMRNLTSSLGSKGLNVRFVANGSASSAAFEPDNKTLRISLNRDEFMEMESIDPEANNRYAREEIAHIGDLAEGAMDAKRQGKDNYRQHWAQQRSNMLSRIFNVAKQDKAVEQSVVAAANLYLPRVQKIMRSSEIRSGANRAAADDALIRGEVKSQFKTISDVQQYMIRNGMSGERGVRAMPLFMAEMLRMLKTYGQPQTEARNFLRTAARVSGGSRTIIKIVGDYLRKVYKALFSIKDNLVKADPALAEDLSSLLSEIDDVLSDSPSPSRLATEPDMAARQPAAEEAQPRAPPAQPETEGGQTIETPQPTQPEQPTQSEPPVLQEPSSAATTTLAEPKTKIVPRGRTVSVNYEKAPGEFVTEVVQLSPEQEAEWAKGEEDYRRSAESAKRTTDPVLRSSAMQSAGYAWAKRKREITGKLHYSEAVEKAKRERSNYLGKRVGVIAEQGVIAATIVGNPFGRVKVRLEDGQELTVLPDQLTSVPEVEQEQEPAAIPSGQVVDFPINKIVVNDKIQQFKKKAKKESGVVKPLTGEYQATPKNPIVVWQRNDGVFEVITGRHRLDLAKRNNLSTVPAQIVKESEGWTQDRAETFDAEANIRDGQGDLEDFAYYFKKSGITGQEAEAKGLLRDDGKGRAGFLIANEAAEDVYAGMMAGKLDGGMAVIIASGAPKSAGAVNESIQRAALNYINSERVTQQDVKNFITGMIATFANKAPSETQSDLFGNDDSALELMKQRAKKASKIQKDVRQKLNAMLNFKKLSKDSQAEALRDVGITIAAGEDAVAKVNQKITDLQGELASWERWATDPAKVSQLDQMPDIKAQAIDIEAQRVDENPEGEVNSNREEGTGFRTSEGVERSGGGGGVPAAGELAAGESGQLQNVEDGRGRPVPGSVDNRPVGGSPENQGLADNAVPAGMRSGGGVEPNLGAIQSLQRRGSGGEAGRVAPVNDAERALGEGLETQVPWVPVIQGPGKALGAFVPAGIADEVRRNLERIDAERGGIENYVAKALGFSDTSELYKVVIPTAGTRLNKEQVETIAAALDRMDSGKACIIGHEMGIGKGRACAALLYIANLRGQTPIFFTANSKTLYPTLMDDFRDLGFKMDPFITDQDFESVTGSGSVLSNKGKNPRALFPSIISSKKLPAGKTMVMTTWDQARLPEVSKVLAALAPNAVFVIDEAHKGTGDSISSGIARGILKNAAGVAFSSGTAIKNLEAMRLYFPFTSINRAIPSVRRLNQLLKKFANPLLELMNRGLVSAGEYIRYQRGLTHEGKPVPFTPLALKTGAQVVEVNNTANEIAGELKQIQTGPFMKRFKAALEPLVRRKAMAALEDKPELAETMKIKIEPYPMKSQFHNIASIMVLASKIPEISKQIKSLVDQGKKVFIASDATGESAVQELLDDVSLETDPKTASFADALGRYTEKLKYITISVKVGPKGRQQTLFRQKLDMNRTQEEYGEAVEFANAVLQQINDAKSTIESSRDVLGRLGISPMDSLRQSLESVQIPSVEISGRSATVMPDGSREKRTELDQDRMASLGMFNNDANINVLAVSRSGSTGINAHNSPKFASNKDRVFFLLQPSPNVVDTVQVAFRVNRTGQMTAPHLYMAYAEELPAEKRIMALTAKKMSKLGASSTGGQRLDMSETFGEDMHNAYGDLAMANVLARDETFRAEFTTRHGERFPGNNEEEIRAALLSGAGNGDIFRRFEHMLIIMPLDIYAEISEQVRDEYNEIVETEKMAGRYNLTSEKMDYKAVLVDDMPGMAPYSPRKEGEPDIGTAQPTMLRRYRFTNPNPPPASEAIVRNIDAVKKEAAEMQTKYNEAAEKFLNDRINFIRNRKMAEESKSALIQAISRKMAAAQSAVADAVEKVGNSYWYHISDTQVPVFVTGLRLNMKYPHILASQRMLIQSAGFNHLMPVPLSANPLSRLASARTAFNNNPLEQNELGIEMPLLDSNAKTDMEANFYNAYLPANQYANAASAWENHPLNLRKKYMQFMMDKAGFQPGFFRVQRHFKDGKTLNGLYFDGSTMIEMSPVRTREMLSYISEKTENATTEKEVVDAFAEALAETEVIDTMTAEGAMATDQGQGEFTRKMNNRRRNQVVAEAYDRERQKAMQQDHFVIVGNPLVGADMATRLFGSQLNHRIMRFTNNDGSETTGIVVPPQAEFTHLRKLSNVLNVKETIQRSDAEKVLDYLNSTITRHHNATEVVFTDGSSVNYATSEAEAMETPHSLASLMPMTDGLEGRLADAAAQPNGAVPEEIVTAIQKIAPSANATINGPYVAVKMSGFDAGNYIAAKMRAAPVKVAGAGNDNYFYATPATGGQVLGPAPLSEISQMFSSGAINTDTFLHRVESETSSSLLRAQNRLASGERTGWIPLPEVLRDNPFSTSKNSVEGYAYSGPRSVQVHAQRIGDEITPEIWNYYRIATQQTQDSDGNITPSPAVQMVLRMFPNMDASYVEDAAISGALKAVKALAVMRTQDPGKFAEMEASEAPEGGIPKKVFAYMVEAAKNSVLTSYQKFGQFEVDPPEPQGMQILEDEETIAEALAGRATGQGTEEPEGPDIVTPRAMEESEATKALRADMEAAFQTIDPQLAKVFVAHNRGMTFEAIADEFGLPPIVDESGKERPNKQMAQRMYDDALRALQEFAGDQSLFATHLRPKKPTSKALRLAMEAGLIRPMSINAQRVYASDEDSEAAGLAGKFLASPLGQVIKAMRDSGPQPAVNLMRAIADESKDSMIKPYYRILAKAMVNAIDSNPASFIARAGNTDVVIDESIDTSHWSGAYRDPFSVGIIRLKPNQLSPRTMIHEFVHGFTAQLIESEVFGPFRGKKEMSGAKYREALTSYAAKQPLDADNPQGAMPAMQSLVKAYLGALKYAKDDAGQPIENAVFGSGLTASFSITLPMHRAPYSGGLFMSAFIDASNSRAVYEHFKELGLNGVVGVPNDTLDDYVNKNSGKHDFIISTPSGSLAGLDVPADGKLILSPSGLEKLRSQGVAPSAYSTYTIRATSPIFKQRILGVVADPGKKAQSVLYGFKNLDEFAAEVMSSPQFLGMIANLDVPKGLTKTPGDFLSEWFDQVESDLLRLGPSLKGAIRNMAAGSLAESSAESVMGVGTTPITEYQAIIGKRRQTAQEKPATQAELFAQRIDLDEVIADAIASLQDQETTEFMQATYGKDLPFVGDKTAIPDQWENIEKPKYIFAKFLKPAVNPKFAEMRKRAVDAEFRKSYQLQAQRIAGNRLEDKVTNTIQAMPRGGLIVTTKGAFSIRPKLDGQGWVTRGIDNPRRVATKTISAAVAGLPGIRGMVQVVKSYTRDDIAPSDQGGEKNPLAMEYLRLTEIPTPTDEQRKRIKEIEKFVSKYKVPGVGVQQSLFNTDRYSGSPNRPTASAPSVIETPPKYIAPQMELALNAQRIFGPRVNEVPATYQEAQQLVRRLEEAGGDGTVANRRGYRLNEFLTSALIAERFEAQYPGRTPGELRLLYLKENPDALKRVLSVDAQRIESGQTRPYPSGVPAQPPTQPPMGAVEAALEQQRRNDLAIRMAIEQQDIEAGAQEILDGIAKSNRESAKRILRQAMELPKTPENASKIKQYIKTAQELAKKAGDTASLVKMALNAQRIEPSGAQKIVKEINDLRAMRDAGQPYNEKRLRQLEFTASQMKLSGYQPDAQLMPTQTTLSPTAQPFALEQETRPGMVQQDLFAQRLDYDERGNPVITPKPLTAEELMSIRSDLLSDLGRDIPDVMEMYRKLRAQPSGTKTLGGVYQTGENGGPARSLANPGQTAEQRDLINAMDAMRFQRGLGVKTDTTVEDAATQILSTQEGRLGVQEAVLSGQALNTETTLAAMKMVGEMTQAAVASGDAGDFGKAYAMAYMYREARSETARTLRAGYDRLMTPAQRHAEFLMAVMVEPKRNRILDLKYYPTEAQNRNDIRSLQATLEDLIRQQNDLKDSTQGLAGDNEASARALRDLTAVLEQREREAEALRSELAATQQRVTREQVMAQEAQARLAEVNRTLAGLGTSVEQLMKESELSEIRTGAPATQMLDQVRLSPKEREAVELIMIGHDPVSVSKQTKVKLADIKTALDTMRAEAKRRFSRIAQGGLSREQLRRALLDQARSQSSIGAVLAQRIPDNQPLTEDEALEEIYNMFGLTLTPSGEYKWADRKGKTNLFDLRKPEHAVILAKAIQAGKPTLDGTLFESYVSSIFSGVATQLANVVGTPLSPISNSIHRGAQALVVYLLGKNFFGAGIQQETADDEIRGGQTPLFNRGVAYKTLAETAEGAINEIGYIWKNVVPAALEAAAMAKISWATEAGFFDYKISGVLEDIDNPQTRFGAFLQKYGRSRSTRIPGKLGRVMRMPLRGLLAADEFSKTFRSYTAVGAHAYRLGKASGLSGEELDKFIQAEVSGVGSTSWMLAARRATKETFTFQLRPEGGETKTIGDFVGKQVGLLSDFYANLEDAATAMDGNKATLPARALIRLIQSFFVLIRAPYNIYREAYAYTPPAIANVASRLVRVRKADGKNYLPIKEYDDVVERITSLGIGSILLLTMMTGAAEGDDDDDKKPWLITGSPDPLSPGGQRTTRFGNSPFKMIFRGEWLKRMGIATGEYVADYSRIEPLATMISANANLVRDVKELKKTGDFGAAGANVVKDYFLSPATRTYGKQWRDLQSLTDLQGSGPQRVIRDKISAIASPNLFKQPFGGIPEYEKDVYSPDPLAADSLLFAMFPGLGDELGIPDRRTFEGMKIPNPEPSEGSGPLARSFARMMPFGRSGENYGKTDFERFVDNYNRQHPDKRWNPDLSRPDRFFDDKYTRQRVSLTNPEYDMVLKMAAPKIKGYLYGNSKEKGVLSTKDLTGFVSEDRKEEIQRTISGFYRDAKKAVVEARHRREYKTLQETTAK